MWEKLNLPSGLRQPRDLHCHSLFALEGFHANVLVPKHLPCTLFRESRPLSKDPLDTEPTVYEIHYSGLSGVNTQILSRGGTSQRRNGGGKLHENS